MKISMLQQIVLTAVCAVVEEAVISQWVTAFRKDRETLLLIHFSSDDGRSSTTRKRRWNLAWKQSKLHAFSLYQTLSISLFSNPTNTHFTHLTSPRGTMPTPAGSTSSRAAPGRLARAAGLITKSHRHRR
ncbi:uncharacterized protein LY89DRAFT_191240 [Mollisia scopiformis]|uniref:Secreted protein n=1 Tax=Mollisia scopiformis TaxID=149040 RepID=A0A194WXL2_MOLSC|nr:uncharacterized protein LY89DRAFT_191240 [Mollisia scopiformis]KUJ12723.1 hypothetical protein LY89DRAFT_191240 [Mollisia scopiformis]